MGASSELRASQGGGQGSAPWSRSRRHAASSVGSQYTTLVEEWGASGSMRSPPGDFSAPGMLLPRFFSRTANCRHAGPSDLNHLIGTDIAATQRCDGRRCKTVEELRRRPYVTSAIDSDLAVAVWRWRRLLRLWTRWWNRNRRNHPTCPDRAAPHRSFVDTIASAPSRIRVRSFHLRHSRVEPQRCGAPQGGTTNNSPSADRRERPLPTFCGILVPLGRECQRLF
jgi:hypothetical protein